MLFDPDLIRRLQERAARALPAVTMELRDGWWLRYEPGGAWWISSVLPHTDSGSEDLARRVVDAEEFYAARGGTARFQITPGACPHRLDQELAERGYALESPVSLQTASTTKVLSGQIVGDVRVAVDGEASDAWFDVWSDGQDAEVDRASYRAFLERVEGPSAYAVAHAGDRPIAVGRAVADTGWAGVFGMVTLPSARGRGAGRAVLTGLAEWAANSGAANMYLQVVQDNAAAVRLYARAGFGEIAGYHYRVRRSRS